MAGDRPPPVFSAAHGAELSRETTLVQSVLYVWIDLFYPHNPLRLILHRADQTGCDQVIRRSPSSSTVQVLACLRILNWNATGTGRR